MPSDFVIVASLKAGHSILRTLDGMDIDRPQDGSFSLRQSAEDRDGDQDGLVDSRDNCPDIRNPLESGMNDDATGDARDDLDGDGSSDGQDCSATTPSMLGSRFRPAPAHTSETTMPIIF
ncbi:MAG: hypothetical protein L0170_07005 [Acidobacteria bacterium]|nr:hypothetical protein [Acidobacteriota bacterium]